jgi:hypothetical protein
MSKDGGPAFPNHAEWESRAHHGATETIHYNGMSLRDYFASKAMQGILTGVSVDGFALEPEAPIQAGPIARDAYRMADAMLKARDL